MSDEAVQSESVETMLSLESVDAWYRSAQALFGVSLSVGEGEVVGLLGRNGAGKSSTFNAIMGLEVRRRGLISAVGRSLDGMSTDAIARLGVSWVPEDRRIFPGLTVRENIELARFAANGRGLVTVDELADALPLLGPLLGKQGNHLSGGEQQLVAVARALVPRPRVLLLDEPTEGLAPLVVDELASAIATLPRNFGVSVLLAEQNLDFVIELSDRVYVLETGRIVHASTTKELAADAEAQHRLLTIGAG
ncbi:amino acid/amide ABC transporter ATP-binding protein 2 (HAAT family) [Jatrophihabitans sp. GAS493]|uniref:ABC transporter ATP-binding protein n=1 Tax=Jatrophihabitans sp. GAS493 TaxID=1907575 RepID=UPI000BB96B85|nr:ABC transporter ATP-binding protein [Jatrophihabitans sp. GAS493]SOD74665.1 amino acid/amide ABC transporter ATP-binding protein 2 (HAAT family) [Jatrophihabitans sp. GAS493]